MFAQRLLEIRSQLAALEAAEMELMNQIIKEAGHDKLGQARLNAVWNENFPINRAYSYTLRQADYNAVMENGSAAQRKMLSEIVTTKPAKPVVKVLEA